MRRTLSLVLVASLPACASTQAPTTPRFDRVCLALSAGAHKGIAHLGAVRELKAAGLPIDCVVGTSMGSLVGGLYAAHPDHDVVHQYQALFGRYAEVTKKEAKGNVLGGGLLGGALALITGGAALPFMAAGAVAGGATTRKIDLKRFVRVINTEVGHLTIEDLQVPYAAFHFEKLPKANQGLSLVASQRGSLASAIGKSIANPLIFKEHDIRVSRYVDAGIDRLAATPVADACKLFPGTLFVAINVNTDPVFAPSTWSCGLIEIRVDTTSITTAAMAGHGAAFESAVEIGAAAARSHLASPQVQSLLKRD